MTPPPLENVNYDSCNAVATYLQENPNIHCTIISESGCGCGCGYQSVVIAWAVVPRESYDLYCYEALKLTDFKSRSETYIWKNTQPEFICHLNLIPRETYFDESYDFVCKVRISSRDFWNNEEFEEFAKAWLELFTQAKATEESNIPLQKYIANEEQQDNCFKDKNIHNYY